MRPIAIDRLIGYGWAIPIKATGLVLLLEDLTDLLHVSVLHEH